MSEIDQIINVEFRKLRNSEDKLFLFEIRNNATAHKLKSGIEQYDFIEKIDLKRVMKIATNLLNSYSSIWVRFVPLHNLIA